MYGNNAARSAVNKKIKESWGEAGSFMYQLGMGLADFTYTMVLSHGLAAGAGAVGAPIGSVAKAASNLSLAIMSTEAAAETVLDAKDRGLEDGDAFWLGTIAGTAEIATEVFSIDALLNKADLGKNALTYLLKNSITEGSEEMASSAINWLADVMISKDKSEWQEILFYYEAMGFSEEESFLAALKEQGLQILKEGAAGAISGMAMSGMRLIGGKIGDGITDYNSFRDSVENGKLYHDLNNMTMGELARSLGNMDIEQEYKTSLPVALEAESRSSGEISSLLEENGYSLEGRFGDGSDHRAVGDEKVQFSIKYDANNIPFVEMDQDILQNIPQNEWTKTIKENLKQKFSDGVIVGNNEIQVDRQSIREMTYSKYTQYLMKQFPELYADKMRITGNADELLQASRNYVNESLNHPRSDNIEQFARGQVQMRIGDNDYKAQVVVAMRSNGKLLLYDILDLTPTIIQEKRKKSNVAIAIDPSPGIDRNTTLNFNTSIPNSSIKVNGSGMNLEQSIRIYGVAPEKAALVTRLANDTGAKVLFDGTLTEECEGYEKNGVIYLNPNADNIKGVFSHELTHVLERTGSYQALRNMVLSQYGNDTALQNALDAKRKEYQAQGVSLTRAEAAQELVAEFAGKRMFTDLSAIRRLASYDLNLAGKIGSAISQMASNVTGDPEKRFLRNAERMYTQAIQEAKRKSRN